MGLSGRRSRRSQERRRKFWGGVAKTILLVGVLGAIGYYAYVAGQEIARGEVRTLQAQVDSLESANRRQEQEAGELRAALESARQKAADFEDRYKRAVPSPELEQLVQLMGQKLAAGVKPERLAAYVAAAERPRRCDGAATKRFIVQTTSSGGDNTAVRFANVLTVTAGGEAAQAANGAMENWYDPAKPVTVTFTLIGGKEQKVSGVLPLHYTMLNEKTEYRFTVAAGSRGFAEVSGDACTAE